MQRQLLSPDKSVRSQKPNKSIRSHKYKHYDNKHIKSHNHSRDRTLTSSPSFQHKSKYCKDLWLFFFVCLFVCFQFQCKDLWTDKDLQ